MAVLWVIIIFFCFKMELDSKDLSIERLNSQIKQKALNTSITDDDALSVSGNTIFCVKHDDFFLLHCCDVRQYLVRFFFTLFSPVHMPKEGWVSIPNKQNIKRYGWKRQVSTHLITSSFK